MWSGSRSAGGFPSALAELQRHINTSVVDAARKNVLKVSGGTGVKSFIPYRVNEVRVDRQVNSYM
jgi:hypothetical protein